jgi:hypothetical protein
VDGSLRRRKPAATDERRRLLWSSLCESLCDHPPETVRRVLARVYPGFRFHELDIAAIADGLRVPFDEAVAAAVRDRSRRAG